MGKVRGSECIDSSELSIFPMLNFFLVLLRLRVRDYFGRAVITEFESRDIIICEKITYTKCMLCDCRYQNDFHVIKSHSWRLLC